MSGESRQEVHGRGEFAAGLACRDFAGPAHQARDSMAAFPGRSLSFAKRPGGASMIAVGEPGAIVAGEDDDRILGEFQPIKSFQNLPNAPIDLRDHIAE